jgi:hypothetical protein
MVYSVVFSADANNYPIPGSLEIIGADSDISTGLSRSFSEIIRGKFSSAKDYNEHGIRIFLFFLLQLPLRLAFSFIYLGSRRKMHWIYLDSALSAVFFLAAFFPFIKRFFEMAVSLFKV